MRWLARLTVAVTLSGIAVVALTVAGWPRPRAVVRIGTSSQVILRNDFSASDGRHRLIQQTGANASFWFLAADGTLLGPWQPGRTLVSRGFDTVGRLLADTPDLDYQSAAGLTCRTYELVRYDPATGREEVVHARPDVPLFGVRLSRDLSTLALATLGDPLTFITYDVATGRQQHIVKVPGRVGSLDPRQALVAACCWDLTPDGQGLVLAGGWDGDRRPDRLGVDVLETASGRMKRRIDLVAPVISPDVGVCYFHFASDGRSVSCGLESRVPAVWTSGWTQGCVWLHGQGNDIDTGELLAEAPDAPSRDAAYGGRTLSVRAPPLVAPRVEYRVTDSAGVAIEDWRPLPGEFGRQGGAGQPYPQPGSAAVVYRFDEYDVGDPRPWKLWLDKRLGRNARAGFPKGHYLYHDYGTGEFRDFPRMGNGPHTHAVGPHDLAILTRRPDGGTLTLWDLPPRRPPWPWSVPAGVAIGVRLTAVGVRLRRAARTRLNRRAELMK